MIEEEQGVFYICVYKVVLILPAMLVKTVTVDSRPTPAPLTAATEML